jgi:hypothetical protein
MSDLRDLGRAVWDGVQPFVPPSVGAAIGLRYARSQLPRARFAVWVCSAAAGLYLGAGLGEFYGLGARTTGALMFLIAMFGTELFAVAVAALRQWAADPVRAFRRWRDAWLGRGDEP